MSQIHLPAVSEQLVTIERDQPLTNTVVIAAKFEKDHKHVLQVVRTVMADCPVEFSEPNFRPAEYQDAQRKARPMYQLTEKAFALVAMGFTGPRFMDWKIRFLEEFERRGRELLQMERHSRDYALGIILENRPLWVKVKRYRGMGLNNHEVARLVGVGTSTLRRHLREMEDLGLIERSPRLLKLQSHARRLFHKAAA